MKVYLASPFFSETERTDYFEALAILRGRGALRICSAPAPARQVWPFAQGMGGGNFSGRSCRSAKRGYRGNAFLWAVFGQRHRVGMRLCVRPRQKDRRRTSARREIQLHDQLFLPCERSGSGRIEKLRFLHASARKLLRIRQARRICVCVLVCDFTGDWRALPAVMRRGTIV